MNNELLLPIILAVIGSNALWAFLQFLIQRNDEHDDRYIELLGAIGKLSEKIDNLKAKEDEDKAIQHRVRILRFNDELKEGRKHSKESFDQVLSDTTYYRKYCDQNKDFENDMTLEAVNNIKRVYRKCMEERDFL